MFSVKVNTLKMGVRAVLSQPFRENSIQSGFYLKKFTAPEQNYDIGSRKLLAKGVPLLAGSDHLPIYQFHK